MQGGQQREDLPGDPKVCGLLGTCIAPKKEHRRLAEELGDVLVDRCNRTEPEVRAHRYRPTCTHQTGQTGKLVMPHCNAPIPPDRVDRRDRTPHHRAPQDAGHTTSSDAGKHEENGAASPDQKIKDLYDREGRHPPARLE